MKIDRSICRQFPGSRGRGHELFSSRLLHRRAATLERGECETASLIVLNTGELRERFCSKYSQWRHKFVKITNGYAQEQASIAPLMDERLQRSFGRSGGSALELCRFGTVYGNRSPLALFRAIQELMDEGRVNVSRLSLRFVEAWDVNDPTCDKLSKAFEESGVLKRIPLIPQKECLKRMEESDELLILQPDYPLQFPAKIYEYIVWAPTVCGWRRRGDSQSCSSTSSGPLFANRVQAVKRALTELMSDRTGLTAPDPADTEQFSYPILSKRLAHLLDDVAQERYR